MARIAVGAIFGLVVGIVGGAALQTHADTPEPDAETVALATEAGVEPLDLLGASFTTGLAPEAYLRAVGLLGGPVPVQVAYNARVACIESKESGGANVANLHGSGAVGVMQYMPGTFYSHAAEMGHFDWSPWTPWQARAVAAHDLALGRRGQWTVSGC